MPQVETVRFGVLDVAEADVIEFRRGLLGFEALTRYILIERDEESPLGWLQSLDDPSVAFVVANPAVFFPAYEVQVDPRELGEACPGPNDRLLVLGICTISERVADICMNLQGPLVINSATRRGKQLVLNRSPYRTKHRLVEVPPAPQKGALRRGWKPRAHSPSA